MIFLRSFEALEEREINQDVERVCSALLVEQTNLDTLVYDWAAWDDTL